jgi:hypothetical protein
MVDPSLTKGGARLSVRPSAKVFVRAPSKKKGTGKKIEARLETIMVNGPLIPPAFNPIPVRRCRRRWLQSAACVNQAFTLADGHSQFLVVTNVLGNAVPFVDCWRIRKIHVWCISEGTASTNVSITPVGADIDSNSYNDRERLFTCSSRSTAEPGHMHIKCAEDQPIGSWHFTSNVNFAGTLFQINVGLNAGAATNRCTLDIEFEYVENFVGLPLGYGKVTATTTLGTVGGESLFGSFGLQSTNLLG